MATSFEQWHTWSTEQAYTILPYIHKWKLEHQQAINIKSWFSTLHKQHQYSALLESGKAGRYTYLGVSPVEAAYGNNQFGYVQSLKDGQPTCEAVKHIAAPLELLRQFMSKYKAPKTANSPKFTGGIMGYLGYDIVRSIEKLPNWSKADLSIPDYYMLRFNEIWAFDQQECELYVICYEELLQTSYSEGSLLQAYNQAEQKAYEMELSWHSWNEDKATQASIAEYNKKMQAHIELESMNIDLEQYDGLIPTTDKAQFIEAVEKIKAYIAAGDVFQVNLSQRQQKNTDITGHELYEWLRLFNPSPYMGYFSTPELQLVSASPELLVEVRDGILATRPIAGTRRRGRTIEEEERFVQELLTSEKEKAEHIMLVDLERNDLGRVSKYGTVKVKELMVIERYSHVMHLVSQIEGELQQHKDCYDVIAATFPGGTITGAPKIRTMEIIEELEPVRRGIYTGSLGWIDYCGDMELNIIIRTMLLHQGQAYVQAGAGVVIDSNPEREYYESLNKAKALWKALQYAESFNRHTIMDI